MKILAVVLLSAVMAAPIGLAQAQTKAAAAKKPAASKNVARKTPPTRTVAAARPAAATAAAAVAATAAATPARDLNPAELALAQHVHTGQITCELGKDVSITADDKHPGFFHVSSGTLRYHMHPVESQTGAMRLEDTRAGAMWLQLGNKSMLMDQKLGKRVADDCAADTQREFAARMKDQPTTNLLGLAQN